MNRRTVVLIALLAACARSEDPSVVTAEWTSTDSTIGSGRMTQVATAAWCAPIGQLTVVALRSDSGVAISYRTDAVRAGEYPIVDTSASRAPSAVVAVRFVQGIKVLALSSDSGSLTLDPGAGSRISGSFRAWFRESGTASPVEVRGQLTGIPVLRDSAACAPTPAP